MKLYIWDDVLRDYTSGIMFAIADSPERARELLKEECSYLPDYDLNKEPEEHDLNEEIAVYLYGGG